MDNEDIVTIDIIVILLLRAYYRITALFCFALPTALSVKHAPGDVDKTYMKK